MANHEHIDILKQGVKVWNEWRSDNPAIEPDLQETHQISLLLPGINLEQTNLCRSYFHSTDFTNANFDGANLLYAEWAGIDLRNASFKNSFLKNFQLTGSSLDDSVLSRSDLTGAQIFSTGMRNVLFDYCVLLFANFGSGDMSGADLTEAQMGWTSLGGNNLNTAKGLGNIRHSGPSPISFQTLSQSGGNISETFLRGCGLSDWEIENAKLFNPNLSNDEFINIQYRMRELRFTQALQIKPLFISYSHSDGAFVDSIEPHLNQTGIRFWRDIHHTTAGRLERQIDQAIRSYPVVLLVLSANSVESDWVQHEARLARKLEKETGSDVLCPIALDDAWKTCRWPERLHEQIMEYNVLDFSQWQDAAAFDRMFTKLVEGLGIFYK